MPAKIYKKVNLSYFIQLYVIILIYNLALNDWSDFVHKCARINRTTNLIFDKLPTCFI